MHHSVAIQGPLICDVCGDKSDPVFNDGATLRCSECEVEFVMSETFSDCIATAICCSVICVLLIVAVFVCWLVC